MNFFEHQDRARKQTTKLIVLFSLAVIAIMAAVNLLILGLVTYGDTEAAGPPPNLLSQDFLLGHLDAILVISLITGGLIGLASLVRSQKLKAGGSVVARELGGTAVETDTRDPLKRRLRNVVEEVAIASGVPVPDIFVLEEEMGINAFAAGYSTSDAAVAVTRGTLETLDRDELQGVVAHEFAHILNGDMRLNIRLIGILFGILALTIAGRLLLHSGSLSRNRNAGGIAIAGLAIMLIGYIGVFFGRWIKASVSRQREYLADASAVQFTRNPESIGGALKKIAAVQYGSKLQRDSEEVGHMLFASGLVGSMFATHPPIEKRIRAIDPNFEMEELRQIHERMQRRDEARKAEKESPQQPPPGFSGQMLDPETLIERIGQPGLGQILTATLLAQSIPRAMEEAAHSGEWASELICALLISSDPDIRRRQLEQVASSLGPESEQQVHNLLDAAADLNPEQRLPLLEMAFPAIRHRPVPEVDQLLALVDELVRANGKVDAFEYALARLLRKQVEDSRYPERSAPGGKRRLRQVTPQVNDLMRIIAHHGHAEEQAAVAAMTAGLRTLGLEPGETHALRDNWHERLDAALAKLDKLRMRDKAQLLRALVTTIQHAGEVVPSEAELLRVICACLHVPLPPLREEQ